MERPLIEYEIREPTGLGLGSFDIFLIRQKLYTGVIHGKCEYRDGEHWRPLEEHPAFGEIIELTGDKRVTRPSGPKVVAQTRITGWKPQEGIEQPEDVSGSLEFDNAGDDEGWKSFSRLRAATTQRIRTLFKKE